MIHLNKLFKNINENININYAYKLTTLIIFFITLNLFISFSILNKLEIDMLNIINEDAYSKIKIGITEYTKMQNKNLNDITDNIIKDINNQYGSEDKLKEDLYELKEDSEIIDIFRKNISNLSNVLIMNSEKVLMGNFFSYNMNSYKNKEYFNINLEDFYSNFKNNKSIRTSFNNIFNLLPLKQNILLGFEKENIEIEMNEFSFEEIYKYISKDISLIDNFYFISYSYLTETGDIFNVSDYDVYGNPVKNDKIVIVKLFSYSDLNNPEITNEINKLKEKKELVEMQFTNINNNITTITLITCITCCILLISILMMVNNKLKKIK